MLKLSSILVCCLYRFDLVSCAPESLPKKVYYDVVNSKQLFTNFITTYDKTYNDEEYGRRLRIFEDNLVKINAWNRQYTDAVFGIGPFADLTYDEIVKTRTGVSTNCTKNDGVEYKPNGRAPESLDWRKSNYVTGVKNQQSCGSCYVFSAMGNIEGLYAKQTGQLISLSDKQGLDCDTEGLGCKGGWPDGVMRSLAKQGGSMRESDYPYQPVQQQCRTDKSRIVVKVTGGNRITINSEEHLKDAVANYGPLSIVMYTAPEMSHMTGGIFNPQTCNTGLHAVVLIGYGTDGGIPYWLIKNSWGANWNEGGFLRLARGRNICDVLQYVTSATISA